MTDAVGPGGGSLLDTLGVASSRPPPVGRPAEVERLIAPGAIVTRTTAARGPTTTSMQDPEGTELCVS